MAIKNEKELLVSMLNSVRNGSERSADIYRELAQIAEDPAMKESLEARAFVSENSLRALDKVFSIVGERPVKMVSRIQDVFVEDFKKELMEIQSPKAKRLFALAKAVHLNHLRIGEYVALVAAADLLGHHGAAVILESCLAEKLAFTERTRRFIRKWTEAKIAEKIAA